MSEASRSLCVPFHTTEPFADPEHPTALVCTVCGEVFLYVYELKLPPNVKIVESVESPPDKAA